MKKKRLLTDKTNGLEDEISTAMSKEIQEEIDWEIILSMLKDMGWTQIRMDWPRRMNEGLAHEIKEWCQINLKGHYKGRYSTWVFENEKDATMFVLRWA